MGQHSAGTTDAVVAPTDGADAVPPERFSRRTLISGGLFAVSTAATGTALLTFGDGAAAGARAAASSPRVADAVTTSNTSSAKQPFALPRSLDPDLLISRASYGRTPGLENDVDRHGATAWLLAQLKPSSVDDPAGAALLARYPRLKWSPKTVHAQLKVGEWGVMQDLVAAHAGRAVWSGRQLNEVMVDFWSNHFNVTCPSSDVWDTRHRYDADVIRRHALGKFENMLLASAFHPSMLVYLNGAESTGAAPNENYGRESMELHTVGVTAGYHERDVQRAALLMTGWEVTDGYAHFTPARHHVGSLTVMGFHTKNASAAGGPTVQRAYLRYLARHPKTAMHIARKLAVRFVSDDPPAALVKRLAVRYRKSGTAIAPVLRELFASPEFAASGGLKVRRPFEHLVATARVLGVKPGTDPQGLMDFAYLLVPTGHAPLGWAAPNGYPDVAAAWQSPAGALNLFNGATSMVHGYWPSKLTLPGAKGLLAHPPRTRAATYDAVARKLYGRRATARERAAAGSLLAATDLPTGFTAGSYQQTETAALVATLFLMSPGHTLR